MPIQLQSYRRQQGVALVFGMVMLVIMTLIGVASMRSSMLEERMSGNTEASMVSLQAAEATLRAAESLLQVAVLPVFAGNLGLYPQPAPGDPPRWSSIDWSDPNASQTYTGFTVAPGSLSGLTAQFIIEELELGIVASLSEAKNKGLTKKCEDTSVVIDPVTLEETVVCNTGTVGTSSFYQVTSRVTGTGGKPVVMLQTTYRAAELDSQRHSWRRLR